ncbi:MAG: carboxypeptidase regulatory-like domain-containing protein, partial [Flavisolibacter sp.]|nr:carboxypeptidase regulatory-like domain-containing protein [Flavisolibacter sp.]
MTMQRAFFFLTAFLLCLFVQAQSGVQTKITIKVLTAKNEPLPLATVTVASLPDSVQKQQKLTDSSGIAIFQLLTQQPYLVRVTYLSYEPAEKAIVTRGNHAQFTITVNPQSKSLNGVVVTATRPLMRQEEDKTIVDPENLVPSSTNAYEIMEKTPGLFIDQDGNIYLNSTTPATIYI